MRDDFATCPRCEAGLQERGASFVCGRCEGVLLGEHDVAALIAEVEAPAELRPLALEPAATGEPALRCPRCVAEMTKHALYGLTVDRCVAHGIWFDGTELQATLHRAGVEHLKTIDKIGLDRKLVFGLATATLIALQVIRFVYF